jgi:flagellin-like hook-associated protein FlgL
MKRLALAGIVTLAFALGAFAQGSVYVDNSVGINYGVAIDTEGNYYSGTYGMEVWELSGATSVPVGINLAPGGGSGQLAYDDLMADGFKKEATFTNQTMNVGTITIGGVDMPDVTPPGSTVVLALAAWDTSDPSWAAMLNNATWNPHGPTESAACGVVAFLNPTANPGISPAPEPAPLTGWNNEDDLVMTAVARQLPSPPTPVGALQVSISPPSVVTAGAQWQVDGGAWQNSSVIASNLLVGTHTVAFSTVTGWSTPASQTVTVSANQTTTAAGTYLVVVSGFYYTINNGTVTITAYTAPGGSVTIPSTIDGLPVTSIGDDNPFAGTGVTSLAIPDTVTYIASGAFSSCGSLTGVYFKGNAPGVGLEVFTCDPATVYYLPGTTGWSTNFAGLPTELWLPQVQTSNANFGVRTNRFGFNITGTSNLVVAVEASTNLVNRAWSPIQTITLTGGSFYFSDPQWTNYPTRFYRLSMP